ncbi:PIN domain-containing protein [Duganella sp. FT80W]|uniref:PIN domain-containing protein n=1 Tax=Duganella guangzhouensis TaxID=2666084 RepID=A0A6I2L040_9BURK|nr:PIN domain-containing protein [Duganella guangzhouensis]
MGRVLQGRRQGDCASGFHVSSGPKPGRADRDLFDDYGVAKRGNPVKLAARVENFLLQVIVLPWGSKLVPVYAAMRVMREAAGAPLAPMDLLIAAHAKTIGATLVTSDAAFGFFSAGLQLEDWSQ